MTAVLRQLEERWTAVRSLGHTTWHHPANADGRVAALLRVFGGDLKSRVQRGPTLAEIGDGISVEVIPRMTGHQALIAPWPDHWELDMLHKVLRPGDRFLDVGANAGIYSLLAASWGAQATAFEAAPALAELLSRNVARNGLVDSVSIVGRAVGSAVGEAQFACDGSMGHVLPSTPVAAATPNGAYLGWGETVIVPVTTLDAELGKAEVRAAKIDVEGFEIEVLRGASELLRTKRISYLQIEDNVMSERVYGRPRAEAWDFLRDHGYELRRLDGRGGLTPWEPTDEPSETIAIDPDADLGLAAITAEGPR